MRQLYFVRHGESELNRRRIFAGQTDTPLTDKGRREAEAVGVKAKNLSIDAIVSSSLSRAFETAQIIAVAVNYPIDKIVVSDIFRERSLGKLEGKNWDDYDEVATDENGVETDKQLLKRARSGLELLKKLPADNVLLVGHGSFSRALRTAIDPSQTYDEPSNGEIARLI